jgi:aspartyl-tRNA(Asn)/glutamyl-tRNA(Gln) amidotransferase subunit C
MLTTDQIKHVAALARLELSEAEEKKYQAQLSGILDYIEKLEEVKTDQVAITAQVSGLTNVWRDDEVKPWPVDEVQAALEQGETEFGQVKVKRVL